MSISLNSKLKITTMPSYTFENTKTGEVYDDYMSIADMESFLEKNKHIKQVISKVNIVSGVSGLTYKNDQGWKENMSRIAEAHPESPLADRYGKKSIKRVKTDAVLKKHRKIQSSKKK